MDSSYIQEFEIEAREHLASINENLVELEKNSEDLNIINELFRSFHTLKGNSAALGFMRFSELAHSLEDLLSEIRDKKLKLNQKVADILFEGIDHLEDGMTKIIDGQEENIDSDNLIKKIHRILDLEENNTDFKLDKKSRLKISEKKIKSLKKEKREIYRVILNFDPSNMMRGAKTLVLINNLQSTGSKILETDPPLDEIKKSKFNSELEIIVATKDRKSELQTAVDCVSGLINSEVLDLNEDYERKEIHIVQEKEHAKSEIIDSHKSDMKSQLQSVRVNMNKLDRLVNIAGELLVNNIRLQDISIKQDYKPLKEVSSEIDSLISVLQSEVMEVRMLPVGNIFTRFSRMIRDLSNKESKKVNFEIKGGEIELDRTILDKLGDPLVHLLRNSVDHGVELPKERLEKGKPEEGNLSLTVTREKNNAVIEIRDDGAGIDPEVVKISAVKKGIITTEEAENMSEKDLQMLIFKPGMSTNNTITEVSGRGVGMDVVLSTISSIGGKVDLESEVGEGTVVTLRLPFSVAIISAFLIRSEDQVYAIPLSSVDRTIDSAELNIKSISGNKLFILGDEQIPIYWLQETLGFNEVNKKDGTVVVISNSYGKSGIVVDEIISQQQILIKNIDEFVGENKKYAGATILGDGSVALVLDVENLFD